MHEIVTREKIVPSSPPLKMEVSEFRNRLIIATCTLLCLVLGIYLLREFGVFLKPLFIAIFIVYLMLPLHKRLVARGVPSIVAYIVIVILIVGALIGMGWLVYYSIDSVENWTEYENKLDALVRQVMGSLPFVSAEVASRRITDLIGSIDLEQVAGPLRTAAGTFVDFATGLLVVLLYLLFLIAEKVSFPRRIGLAFSEERAVHIMHVIETINEAISHYIVIKTLMSFLTGALAMLVLGVFQVDFYVMWGLLTFFLNYMPYIGSAITIPAPVLLTFLQFSDEPWKGVVVLILLLAVHQGTGQLIEPRMMGARLGVSPLLILVALSFWGVVWGVVGMILAVPLLVVLKIVLQNIKETQPVAILMSNA